MNCGLGLRVSATPDTLARGHCVASCSVTKAAGQGGAPSFNSGRASGGGRGGSAGVRKLDPHRPMPMADFVSQFSVIAPDIELPPGFPPQRVFHTLDRDRNRILDPGEMKTMLADITKMIADFKPGQKPPPRSQSPEDREAMKKAAKERIAKAKDPAQNGGGKPAGANPPELNEEQFFKRAAQRSPGEDPRKVFARVDKDKSGSLSADEMRGYYKETAQAGKDLLKQRQRQEPKRNPWSGKKKEPFAVPNHEMLFAVCVASSPVCARVCASASLRKIAEAPVC